MSMIDEPVFVLLVKKEAPLSCGAETFLITLHLVPESQANHPMGFRLA